MLGKDQDVQSVQQHCVHMQEVHRDDPGGLGVQELPPRRARAAWRWIDARSTRDLPHGRRRGCHAGFRQFAVDPAISRERVLLREANDKAGDAGTVGGRPDVRLWLVSYLLAVNLRCQASSVAGVTGKISVQHWRGSSRASAASHTRSAGSYRIWPACRRSTAFSCRTTSSSASFVMSLRSNSTAKPGIRRTSR
jgi:hypothetical protein